MLAHLARPSVPLHVPGHKGGRGLDPQFAAWVGGAARLDLTELDGLDSLQAPQGPIAQAQRLASDLWKADRTFFLVGGSTVGILAMILAACAPGETLILPRDAHMSATNGLVLAGARPHYLPPSEGGSILAGPPSVEAIVRALEVTRARAVLLARPSYPGGLFDLRPYAERTHAMGALLLVDEAHGAHLGLHPDLPESALAQGADAVVQSTHKMLGALTPGAMLHMKGARLEPDRVARTLGMLQTSSPSYLVLASLDAARREAALTPPERWVERMRLGREARDRIAAVPGLLALPPGDPLKIALDVSGLGLDGYQAADALAERGVIVEHATENLVVAFLGPGTEAAHLEALVEACRDLPPLGTVGAAGLPSRLPPQPFPPLPPMERLPREAFFAESRAVSWESALGGVSAELVCPYPPGSPALVPGERITREVVEYLDRARALGCQITGPSDPTLSMIRILR